MRKKFVSVLLVCSLIFIGSLYGCATSTETDIQNPSDAEADFGCC